MVNFRLHRFIIMSLVIFSAVIVSVTCSKKDEDKNGSCCDLAGDVSNDGKISIGDISFLVDFIYNKGTSPSCFATADMNNDCIFDTLDFWVLHDFMFEGGPAPVCGCAEDPEEENSNYLIH